MINRNNYEEFFLMYVDNELSSPQRTEVETFVQSNPDLGAEFSKLLQTKLSPADTFEFAYKDELIKQGSDAICMNNYQEYFLLYIDGELNAVQKEETELFVLQHPLLQNEFTLLKQTVLPADTIVFNDKASLLRRETKVLRFTWMRIAAAAVLLLAAVSVWQIANKTVVNNDQPVVQNDGEIKTPPPVAAEKENQVKKDENKSIQDDVAVNQPEQKKDTDVKAPVEKIIAKQQALKEKEEPVYAAVNTEKQKDNPANLIANSGVLVRVNETAPAPDEITNTPAANNNAVTVMNADASTSENNYVQSALYKELNTDADANNNAMYVGSVQINKNKVRGLIKKVGGLFAGRSKNAANNQKDEKLQVAGFEINTN